MYVLLEVQSKLDACMTENDKKTLLEKDHNVIILCLNNKVLG